MVHAFHAGPPAEFGSALARALSIPLVVTVTGTDLNLTLDRGAEPLVALPALAAARAVVAITPAQVRALAGCPRVDLIPQALTLGSEPYQLPPARAGQKTALLLGGLRQVKGQDFALSAFERCSAQLADWRLVLAGPIIDPEFASAVLARVRALPNALYVGEIPHGAVPAAMRASDALLSASESEGEPQVILEAQCVGLCVVARAVRGNRELVEAGVTGWLFETPAELAERLVRLGADPSSGAAVAGRARAARADRLDLGREIRAHLALYASLAPR